MKILFKIFPQKSHLNATFFLARILRELGHEVIYAGVEALRGYVESQGNRYIVQTEDVFKYAEPRRNDPKLTYRTMLMNWHRNRKWGASLKAKHSRCGAFDALIAESKPDLVLVDSPYTFFALSLFKHGIPFAILESMGNLGRHVGCPPGDSIFVPRDGLVNRLFAELHWTRYFIKRWCLGILRVRVDFDRTYVVKTARAGGVESGVISFDRYFHIGIKTVPEFILSPREFDFPRNPDANQYYIGPSVEMNREESASDYLFESKFSELVEERKKGIPLVYCSLGTAAWRYDGAEEFLSKLVTAVHGEKCNLVVAIGTELELRLTQDRPVNVHVFQNVPQLRVLRNTDLMITHGGMNSITECILSGVPMLVYPGTTQIDQAGNAARIAYHRLGLFGSMKRATEAKIRRQIAAILRDQKYQHRVEEMGRQVRGSEAFTRGKEIFFEAVRLHFPNVLKPVQGSAAGGHLDSSPTGVAPKQFDPSFNNV